MKYRLSVIIPCLNEQATVPKLLEELRRQNQDGVQVIVSDSGSTDSTAAVAKKAAHGLNFKLVAATKRGVGLARNTGAAAADGDWLLFIDADTLLYPDFVAKALAATNRRDTDIAGVWFRANSSVMFDKVLMWLFRWYCRWVSKSRQPNFPGFCVLVRRSLHEHIHGFNEQLSFSEDTDYAARAVGSGAKLRFDWTMKIAVSMRRFDEKGRARMLGQYLYAEFVRASRGGKVTSSVLSYNFGDYKPTKKPK